MRGIRRGRSADRSSPAPPIPVILFDEIEKAHPEVWNSLLQILDDGRLTDGQGRVADFRNTVLIMTSNLGTEFVQHGGTLGFLRPSDSAEDRSVHEKIDKALKSTFRPEFLNRIDEIIMFSPLSLDLQMKEIRERMQERGLDVELTEAAAHWLAQQGYEPAFGARPLKRALQKYVESPLSVSLLSGQFATNDTVVVDLDPENKQLVFRKKATTG